MAEHQQQSDKPIKIEQHYQLLQGLRIVSSDIGPKEVTISPSGKFLCARTTFESLFNVDLQDVSAKRQQWEGRFGFAQVNPNGKYIVLKHVSQAVRATIYKTEERLEKVMDCTFPDEVVFLKWIADDVVAVVTTKEVYHWSIVAEDEEPVKMFDRDENLSINFAHVINYQTDPTRRNFFMLTGCRRGPEPLFHDGFMELYSVDSRERRTIDGPAAAFVQFKMDGSSTLLCYAERDFTEKRDLTQEFRTPLRKIPFRLHIEFHGTTGAPAGFTDRIINIDMDSKTQEDDFPVGIQVGHDCEVIYLMTRFGFVYVYLTASGQLVWKEKVSKSEVFATEAHGPSTGIIAVNHGGQVFSVYLKDETFIA